MAFVCPEKCEERSQLLSKLKALVGAIDDGGCPPPCIPVCGPCGPCCPPCAPPCCPPCSPPYCGPCSPMGCCPPCCTPGCLPIVKPVQPACPPRDSCKPKPKPHCEAPQMMVAYRIPNCNRPPKECSSRELRMSNLYMGCDCEKRNGLQDDCPRFLCQGSPCCLTKPEASCCPGQFSGGKHLKRKSGVCPSKNLEEYQCYPAYVRLPAGCPAPCGPCGPCSPYVPIIPAPPCPPPACPPPPPNVAVGQIFPALPGCPTPQCCPCPC